MLPDSDFQTPDPNGPPVPEDGAKKFVVGAAGVLLTVFIGGVGAAFLLTVVARPTSGARHSYRLEWQQRQNEVAAAQAQTDADHQPVSSDAEQAHE